MVRLEGFASPLVKQGTVLPYIFEFNEIKCGKPSTPGFEVGKVMYYDTLLKLNPCFGVFQ